MAVLILLQNQEKRHFFILIYLFSRLTFFKIFFCAFSKDFYTAKRTLSYAP